MTSVLRQGSSAVEPITDALRLNTTLPACHLRSADGPRISYRRENQAQPLRPRLASQHALRPNVTKGLYIE
jgi:hypothetical protein